MNIDTDLHHIDANNELKHCTQTMQITYLGVIILTNVFCELYRL